MNWKDKQVLVTGAGGFIGSHLVERLLSEGARVRAMVRYNSRNSRGQLSELSNSRDERLEVVAGDIRDSRFVTRAVGGSEVVFHLAALIGIPYSYIAPSSYVETNIAGTLNVLEAVKETGAPRIVHTSTSEVYGSALYVPIDENHPLQGQSPYSASKIGADKLAESYYNSFAVPVVTLRPFNTYGPRQSPRAILPTVLLQALSADSIHLGSLEPVRDFTYVTDTVDGFLRAGSMAGIEGETINLGTGEGFSVTELVKMACDAVGRHPKLVIDEQRVRPKRSEVMRLVSSNARAREKLGWTPSVALDKGLELMLPWFRDNPDYYDASLYNV